MLLFRIGARTGPAIFLLWCAVTVVVGLSLWRRSGGLLSRRIAGALLIFPGPLSDILAVILLVPALRTWILRGVLGRGGRQGQDPGSLFKDRTYGQRGPSGRNGGEEASTPGGKGDSRWPRGEVKDAEFRILPEEQPGEGRGSDLP
ncbi:MAG TPA: FxsA family protein [Planctomycetota bacterium]|nr:FxsA family protein [Planctomycetota bacterium]